MPGDYEVGSPGLHPAMDRREAERELDAAGQFGVPLAKLSLSRATRSKNHSYVAQKYSNLSHHV